MVTCLERADLLALLRVMFYCIFSQVWCLIGSIPGRCLLLYRSLLSLILNTGVQSSRLFRLFVLPRYSVMSGTKEPVSVTAFGMKAGFECCHFALKVFNPFSSIWTPFC